MSEILQPVACGDLRCGYCGNDMYLAGQRHKWYREMWCKTSTCLQAYVRICI